MTNFGASKTLFLKAFWSLENGLDESTITKARFPRSRVMRMKSLRKLIPLEFSDVMITYVACKRRGEARDANPTNYEK